MYNVSQVIGTTVPIFSAVVFVQGNVQYINAHGVYTLSGLKRLLKNGSAKLTEAQMEEIYTKLSAVNDRTITKSEHIHNIYNLQNNLSNNICPRCGKKLVIRNGKNGSFMGCENYPKCKFTKNI